MGIKKLLTYIRDNHSVCNEEHSIMNLTGKVLCIDTPCLMYKLKMCNSQHDFFDNVIYFLLKIMECHIDCIFVLEGKSPDEKKETKNGRAKAKEQLIQRTLYLKSLLEEYKKEGDVNSELLHEWNKLNINEDFNEFYFENMIKRRQIYEKQVTKEDYNVLVDILDVFSIPHIKSYNEAETTCAFLVQSKKADYIFSQDSDVLAYKNVKGMITDLNFTSLKFSYINKVTLLESIGFNEDEFIDFCILCGTDYNRTIKRIGIITSKKMLQEKRRIENLTLNHEDLHQLNVNWIRSKFSLDEFKNINPYEELIIPWPRCQLTKLKHACGKHGITLSPWIENCVHLHKKLFKYT
nr:MAG: flap structure-specific endonuclease [Diabrotica toursvirus 3a]